MEKSPFEVELTDEEITHQLENCGCQNCDKLETELEELKKKYNKLEKEFKKLNGNYPTILENILNSESMKKKFPRTIGHIKEVHKRKREIAEGKYPKLSSDSTIYTNQTTTTIGK